LAAAIKNEYNIKAELIPSGGGIFDVAVDGKRIWSRHQTGRFPENREVLERIADLTGKS